MSDVATVETTTEETTGVELDTKKLQLIQDVRAARRVSTPIVAITTPDPGETQQLIVDSMNGNSEPPPCIAWDIVRGLYQRNDAGADVLAAIDEERLANSESPEDALKLAQEFPSGTVMFFHNAQRFVQDTMVMQALYNLRDLFKTDRRMVVLLGPQIDLPIELRSDVIEFDEPLPDDEQLQHIVSRTLDNAKNSMERRGKEFELEVTDELIRDTATKLKGTHAFAAEQLTAMSLRVDSINGSRLQQQAKKLIEQTKGLTFEVGGETFDDIGGLEFAKEFGRLMFAGPNPPAVIVRVEELEKTMSGATGGDLSGTSSDALQVLLSEMEDQGWGGMLAYGPPGAGKSLYSKSAANTHGAAGIRFDINACKDSLVGQSEKHIRAAMKVILTLGGSRVFFVASVNKLASLPPELQRRFTSGVWFFDIPNAEQRQQIWEINRRKFEIPETDKGLTETQQADLTGADIRNLCKMARDLQVPLKDARRFVVPLKVQSPDAIRSAREKADGKFLCANHGDVYKLPAKRTKRKGREVSLTETT